jgi:prepilin-type N-terminal cleavage/methylation domain-containing protein
MKNGFTLVEVMVTTIIVGVIGVGFYGVLHTGSNTYYMDSNTLELQQQARNGLDRMVRELRQASAASAVITSSSSSSYKVVFNTPTVTGIQYYLTGTQLTREYPAGTKITIASEISYLKFTLSSPTLTIEIHAGKTFFRPLLFSLIETVTLRNA